MGGYASTHNLEKKKEQNGQTPNDESSDEEEEVKEIEESEDQSEDEEDDNDESSAEEESSSSSSSCESEPETPNTDEDENDWIEYDLISKLGAQLKIFTQYECSPNFTSKQIVWNKNSK